MPVADPSFWRDLGNRFQALHDPLGMLRADWHSVSGSGERDWRLCGASDQSTRARFEALAREAGAAQDDKGSGMALFGAGRQTIMQLSFASDRTGASFS